MNRFQQWVSTVLVIVICALVTACSFNPLGMSDEEWAALSPAQKLEARKVQNERDEAARVRRAEQAAQQAAEKAKLVELRSSAPFGDVVQCAITNARGRFAKGKWYQAQPVSIEMHRSESERRIDLVRQDPPSMTTQLHMGFDGLNVKICRWRDRYCDVLAGTESQFRRGITRQINVKKTVEGKLFCSFPRGW